VSDEFKCTMLFVNIILLYIHLFHTTDYDEIIIGYIHVTLIWSIG